ncbi:MAG: vanadium nitrogenase [Lachnospiraceae bacterium]|nr:vanadium nitrogenase [Lachnospiraceae bacterium]
MAFLSELLIESVKFIFLVVVAGVGVFAGITLRKVKDKKKANEADVAADTDNISEE